jgi:hypothetical protein
MATDVEQAALHIGWLEMLFPIGKAPALLRMRSTTGIFVVVIFTITECRLSRADLARIALNRDLSK